MLSDREPNRGADDLPLKPANPSPSRAPPDPEPGRQLGIPEIWRGRTLR